MKKMSKEIKRGMCSCGKEAYISIIQWNPIDKVVHFCKDHAESVCGRFLEDIEDLMYSNSVECPECKNVYVEENICNDCGKCVIWCCECDTANIEDE